MKGQSENDICSLQLSECIVLWAVFTVIGHREHTSIAAFVGSPQISSCFWEIKVSQWLPSANSAGFVIMYAQPQFAFIYCGIAACN
jgi:hypothetical protein